MSYPKSKKTISHVRPVPAPKPLTDEEKMERASAFLAQKKEQYFQGCLFSLLSNPAIVKDSLSMNSVVDTANGLADIVLEKLYHLKNEE